MPLERQLPALAQAHVPARIAISAKDIPRTAPSRKRMDEIVQRGGWIGKNANSSSCLKTPVFGLAINCPLPCSSQSVAQYWPLSTVNGFAEVFVQRLRQASPQLRSFEEVRGLQAAPFTAPVRVSWSLSMSGSSDGECVRSRREKQELILTLPSRRRRPFGLGPGVRENHCGPWHSAAG